MYWLIMIAENRVETTPVSEIGWLLSAQLGVRVDQGLDIVGLGVWQQDVRRLFFRVMNWVIISVV
jgi:hypothetical protein